MWIIFRSIFRLVFYRLIDVQHPLPYKYVAALRYTALRSKQQHEDLFCFYCFDAIAMNHLRTLFIKTCFVFIVLMHPIYGLNMRHFAIYSISGKDIVQK